VEVVGDVPVGKKLLQSIIQGAKIFGDRGSGLH